MKKIILVIVLSLTYGSVITLARAENSAAKNQAASETYGNANSKSDSSSLDALLEEADATPAAAQNPPTPTAPTKTTAPAAVTTTTAATPASAPTPGAIKPIPLQVPVRMRIEETYDASGDHMLQTAEIKNFLKFVIGEVKAKGKYKVDSDLLTVQDANQDGMITPNELGPFEAYVH